MFGNAVARFGCPAALFAPAFGGGFGEEELVVPGGGVRGEVGGDEEEAGEKRELGCYACTLMRSLVSWFFCWCCGGL